MILPEDFLQATRLAMGEERFSRFLAALDEQPPVSIRLNPRKTTAGAAAGADRVAWCSEGAYLASRPDFTFDPLLHAGCYYVQEASSMFVSHVLRHLVRRPVAVLDMCAAPGGKSTAAIASLPEGSLLVSNEPVGKRAQVLSENIQKWGYPGCTVTSNMPADFSRSGAQFDVVLCDVPCSGEGMFRKDPASIGQWSKEGVERCWRLQRDIVEHAWQCLADGGLLVYSTCTYNTLENEHNVSWACSELGARLLSVPTLPEWGITGSLLSSLQGPVYRFIPGFTRGEGLFMAVLQKGSTSCVGPTGEDRPTLPQPPSAKQTRGWHVVYSGPTAGTAKGRDLLPDHAEALQADFDRSRRPLVELTYRQALDYLRREAITLPQDTPRGVVCVSFKGRPLGFVKNIGSRANNLYPQEWKIKTTHLPDTYTPVI